MFLDRTFDYDVTSFFIMSRHFPHNHIFIVLIIPILLYHFNPMAPRRNQFKAISMHLVHQISVLILDK